MTGEQTPMVVDIQQSVGTSNIHVNVKQNFILVTEDRLRLCLGECLRRLVNREAWIGPVTTLLALVTTLATSTFHAYAGLTADVWQAIFVLLTLATSVWLWRSLAQLRGMPTLDTVVDELKNASSATTVATKEPTAQ